MYILQKPDPCIRCITKAVWFGSHFPLGFVAYLNISRSTMGSSEACDVSSDSHQVKSGSDGSWQTWSCTKALAFIAGGRE